jgi:hypothetical protein
LLAKPSPLNINLGSDRFSMFNKKAGHPHVRLLGAVCDRRWRVHHGPPAQTILQLILGHSR